MQLAYRMCETRMRKAKRDIRTAKRRARQLRRMRAFIENPTFPLPAELPQVDTDSESDSEWQEDCLWKPDWPQQDSNTPQTAHLQQLADATIRLMYRNSEIQRRVAELKQDTAAYVVSVMSNPENRERFVQYLGAPPAPSQTSPASESSVSMPSEDDRNQYNIDDDTDVACEVELKNER